MSNPETLKVAVGGDHAGFALKQLVVDRLNVERVQLIDCGTDSEASCDYPDFARAVAAKLRAGEAERGILICGSGVGVSVAANKIPGIRASVCHDTYTAHQGVEHDDMNVLCIGGRVIGPSLAYEIVRAFLAARYAPEERHARRLTKLFEIEQEFCGGTQP